MGGLVTPPALNKMPTVRTAPGRAEESLPSADTALGPGVGCSYLWGSPAFGGDQDVAQSESAE